jgi:hypothetical protein
MPDSEMKRALTFIQSVSTAAPAGCFLLYLTVAFFLAPLALSGQNTTGSWSGVIVSSAGNADEAF